MEKLPTEPFSGGNVGIHETWCGHPYTSMLPFGICSKSNVLMTASQPSLPDSVPYSGHFLSSLFNPPGLLCQSMLSANLQILVWTNMEMAVTRSIIYTFYILTMSFHNNPKEWIPRNYLYGSQSDDGQSGWHLVLDAYTRGLALLLKGITSCSSPFSLPLYMSYWYT